MESYSCKLVTVFAKIPLRSSCYLVQTIPPSSIPALFQVSLEPELLKSILYTFQAVLEQDSTPDARDGVRDYLLAFTKVQRFGTVMLFMDKQERHLFELLHGKVNSAHS